MTDAVEVYRVVCWKRYTPSASTGEDPVSHLIPVKSRLYSNVSLARNARSQFKGMTNLWAGDGFLEYSSVEIQKLEPIFKFTPDGLGFQVEIGWVSFE